MKPFRRSASAFTLLEIMLVVMIIAILAGSAIYLMKGNVDQVRFQRADMDVTNISVQVDLFQAQNLYLPDKITDLVVKPSNSKFTKWRKLMDSVPVDPWGTEYVLEAKNRSTKASYDLYSCGPDRAPHTSDDIGNW
jgi:general secretion pathway protein G